MTKITIETDPPHSSGVRARLFEFPDGVARLIALPDSAWRIYDTLDAAWGLAGDYEQFSLERAHAKFAVDHPGFEAEIRRQFAIGIEMGWSVYNQELHGSANENG